MSGSPPALAPAHHETASSGRRTRAFVSARRHSATVRVLKVAIPLGAAATLGFLVLVSTYKPFGSIPGLTLGQLSLSGSKIAMESPRLTGFRKDNRPYEVTASAAYQDIRRPNVIELKEMRAKLALDGQGSVANFTSSGGVFDTSKEQLELPQPIRLWTAKGEEALLRSAFVDMKAGTMLSRDPVKVTTPTMSLEAAAMQMSDNGRTVSFTGRVRVQLTPEADAGLRGKAVAGTPAPTRLTDAVPPSERR